MTAAYKYDAWDRRIMKVVTNKGSLNGTTRFLWGGGSNWQCLEQRDSSGDLVARYTYAPGYIDDVAVQERDLNDDQDFGDDDEVVYYYRNTLFSIYALTDGSETVVERYRYDAYGGCAVLDADGSADSDGISDVGNAYAFTGRRLDLESGLMQYRHRGYSPTLGRFLTRDPLGQTAGSDLYEYVGASPVMRQDAFGLRFTDEYCKGLYDEYEHLQGTHPGCSGAKTCAENKAGLAHANKVLTLRDVVNTYCYTTPGHYTEIGNWQRTLQKCQAWVDKTCKDKDEDREPCKEPAPRPVPERRPAPEPRKYVPRIIPIPARHPSRAPAPSPGTGFWPGVGSAFGTLGHACTFILAVPLIIVDPMYVQQQYYQKASGRQDMACLPRSEARGGGAKLACRRHSSGLLSRRRLC